MIGLLPATSSTSVTKNHDSRGSSAGLAARPALAQIRAPSLLANSVKLQFPELLLDLHVLLAAGNGLLHPLRLRKRLLLRPNLYRVRALGFHPNEVRKRRRLHGQPLPEPCQSLRELRRRRRRGCRWWTEESRGAFDVSGNASNPWMHHHLSLCRTITDRLRRIERNMRTKIHACLHQQPSLWASTLLGLMLAQLLILWAYVTITTSKTFLHPITSKLHSIIFQKI